MLFRITADAEREYHVLLTSHGKVVSDEIVRCRDNKSAFDFAERAAFSLEVRGHAKVDAYVLNQDQVFIGSANASFASLPLED